MRLIGWKERQRRMRAAENEGWELAGHVAADPGLRERYGSLPRAPIRLIACPLIKSANHGGLLRLAEAFRIERVDFSPEPDDCIATSAQRGTRPYQPHRWIDAESAIAEARTEGLAVAALTLSRRSVVLDRVNWSFPLAIVVGSENEGVPLEIEELCDISVAIPLFGMVTSLNLASASAIVLQDAVREYRRRHEFVPARSASRGLLAGDDPLSAKPPEVPYH